uniref:Uncharacterized protein n=1 Tax=Rhizophora mucronata TaxID=61149 RepID=A0A2P2QN56_RHIMU
MQLDYMPKDKYAAVDKEYEIDVDTIQCHLSHYQTEMKKQLHQIQSTNRREGNKH